MSIYLKRIYYLLKVSVYAWSFMYNAKLYNYALVYRMGWYTFNPFLCQKKTVQKIGSIVYSFVGLS